MILMIRSFSSLKDLILWIPGKENEGFIRYLCEDGKDGPGIILSKRVNDFVNAFKSGKVFKRFQGRGA